MFGIFAGAVASESILRELLSRLCPVCGGTADECIQALRRQPPAVSGALRERTRRLSTGQDGKCHA